jgi:hypothetical protein
MEKSRYHPDNIDWDAVHEKELQVKAENEVYGLPFDMGTDLEEYIKKKEALALSSTGKVRIG